MMVDLILFDDERRLTWRCPLLPTRRPRNWCGLWCELGLVLRLLLRIEHQEIRVVIHLAESLTYQNKVTKVLKSQIQMIRQVIEKLCNFPLYQKE